MMFNKINKNKSTFFIIEWIIYLVLIVAVLGLIWLL